MLGIIAPERPGYNRTSANTNSHTHARNQEGNGQHYRNSANSHRPYEVADKYRVDNSVDGHD